MSRGPAVVRRIHPGARLRIGLLALALLLLLPGCATVPLDTGGGGPGPLSLPLVQGRVVEVDGFEELLLRAGLDDADLLPAREAEFTPEDAAELYDRLLARPITLARFGTRLAASFLLREIMEGEEELSRPALLSRVKRFESLAVLRPDGYLAWGTVPPLPAPVHIERVEDKGTLIVLTPERFTVSNPDHVALAGRVHELLDRAKLLGPVELKP